LDDSVNALFGILALFFLLATVASLFLGLGALGAGGVAASQKSNRLMRWRILCQGGAILFGILYLLT